MGARLIGHGICSEQAVSADSEMPDAKPRVDGDVKKAPTDVKALVLLNLVVVIGGFEPPTPAL